MRDPLFSLAVLALAAAIVFHAIAPAQAQTAPPAVVCDRVTLSMTPAKKAEEFMNEQAGQGKRQFVLGSIGDTMVACAW